MHIIACHCISINQKNYNLYLQMLNMSNTYLRNHPPSFIKFPQPQDAWNFFLFANCKRETTNQNTSNPNQNPSISRIPVLVVQKSLTSNEPISSRREKPSNSKPKPRLPQSWVSVRWMLPKMQISMVIPQGGQSEMDRNLIRTRLH